MSLWWRKIYKSKLAWGAAGVVATVVLGKTLKSYMGATFAKLPKKLEDHVYIVTGANSGIGQATAEELGKRGARVIMACRDIGRCQVARKQIVLNTHNRHVVCRDLDLASYKSIVEFAARIAKEERHLDGLVNNAGVQTGIYERELTREGIEANFGVNHLGHFLLTALLLDKLKANGEEARIVNVSSEVHYKGNINFDDLNMDENYGGRSAYDRSKLAQVLFTRELAKRFAAENAPVSVTAVHPGLTHTELNRHSPYQKWTIPRLFYKYYMALILRNPRQGAQPVLHALLAEEMRGKSGVYVDSDLTIKEPSDLARDDKMALRLWLTSEKWTRLVEMRKLFNERLKEYQAPK